MWFAPALSARVYRGLVPLGNVIILLVLVAILYKIGACLEAGESLAGGSGIAAGDRLPLGSATHTRGTVPDGSDLVYLQCQSPHWSCAFTFRRANAG